eukprot:353463-Chlamydomonas_euryale.AAC.2
MEPTPNSLRRCGHAHERCVAAPAPCIAARSLLGRRARPLSWPHPRPAPPHARFWVAVPAASRRRTQALRRRPLAFGSTHYQAKEPVLLVAHPAAHARAHAPGTGTDKGAGTCKGAGTGTGESAGTDKGARTCQGAGTGTGESAGTDKGVQAWTQAHVHVRAAGLSKARDTPAMGLGSWHCSAGASAAKGQSIARQCAALVLAPT